MQARCKVRAVGWAVVLLAGGLLPASAGAGVADASLDDPMLSDPHLPRGTSEQRLPEGLVALWLRALERPEADLKRRAAGAIAEVHEEGLLEAADRRACVAALRQTLESASHRLVRLAAVHALGVLDGRAAREQLAAANAAGGVEMVLRTDPILARWGADLADRWLERVRDERAWRVVRRSAIESLGEAGAAEAVPVLVALIENGQAHATLRLSAARAVGRLAEEGLLPAARRLAGGGVLGRLLAGEMMAGHRGEAAQRVAGKLAGDPEPAVARLAGRWLLAVVPEALGAHLERFAGSGDAALRELAVAGCRELARPPHVAMLGRLMDDPHPDIRRRARRALAALEARPALEAPIREAIDRSLDPAAVSWRGAEQAALLAGEIGYEAAAEALVPWLKAERGEPATAAAAGLRRLAVPETFAPALAHVEALMVRWDARRQAREAAAEEGGEGETVTEAASEADRRRRSAEPMVASQLFQLFGQVRYRPAESVARRLVPKETEYPAEARGAAIWALGHLLEGNPDKALGMKLGARLSDLSMMDPEAGIVRRMSAITIGRMEARSLIRTLKRFADYEKGGMEVGGACQWALNRMTGEPIEEPPHHEGVRSGWFLEPVSSPGGDS